MKASEEVTEANLVDALHRLAAATGVSMHSVARCCIGTAGNTVPLVVDWLRDAFARHVGGELILIGDVEIALDAAFFGKRGILVLSGTGSNVAGRGASGVILTSGGWGPALADQGSGHFIGLEGLRRGFLAIDQQRPTRLLDVAQAHWNLASLRDLIEFGNANPAPNFSTLAPLVVECAERGDLVAREVLEKGGQDLAYLAGLLIERIRSMEASSQEKFDPPAVAIAGSILEHVALVRESMYASLRQRYPGIVFLETAADPPAGALWIARNRNISSSPRERTSQEAQA
jgi:N-acetylglucosamine kinase-like BadF-type ATPase